MWSPDQEYFAFFVIYRCSVLPVRSPLEGEPYPAALGAAPAACRRWWERWDMPGSAEPALRSYTLERPAAAWSNHKGELGHSLSSEQVFQILLV